MPGDVPLSAVSVDDPLCVTQPVLDGAVNIGDTDGDGWLDVGESWEFTCDATLTADTTNTATAWGTAPWGEEVWATDTAFVDVIAPQLSLVKTADRTAVSAGEVVNFVLNVRNTGDSVLGNVFVTDSLEQCQLSSPTGDDGNGMLDPAEAWSYSCAVVMCVDQLLPARPGQTPPACGRSDGLAMLDLPDNEITALHIRPGASAYFDIQLKHVGPRLFHRRRDIQWLVLKTISPTRTAQCQRTRW